MKSEIILTVIFTSLCLCDRRQRSTVLTDESKRVMEHFDFSNFDRQEALNYLDRQRFENQIRGKRSHTKFKRDRQEIHQKTPSITSNFSNFINEEDIETLAPNEVSRAEESNIDAKPEIFKNEFSESSSPVCENQLTPTERAKEMYRNRRGHRLKKKRKYKYDSFGDNNENREKVDSHKTRRKKKKSKKKKKKKKKKKRHYWDKWSEWSPCSVTCGRGRKIRWRKCIAKNCTTGELEMGEKTCQLPACNLLTKLLGL